ncbi:MAG TPA: threonine/serine dehydratase [Candidatus Acidoferrales bacterium]
METTTADGLLVSNDSLRATAPDFASAVTLADILSAQARIAPFIRRTPLVRSESLSDRFGSNFYLKLELFQKTGAFKVRGAFNKILAVQQSESGLSRGVLAVSGGNHGQAVAYAAQTLGLKSLLLMPEYTPQNFLDSARRYGADVVLTRNMVDAFDRAPAYEAEGWTLVHPYDDPAIIAGQGTVGLEIMEDLPQTTDVFVSIGGGGLASGLATAAKSQKPNLRVWGVETEGADVMSRAWQSGRVVEIEKMTSLAKTLGAPSVCDRTLVATRQLLESVTVVSDREAFAELEYLLDREKIVTELAASCTLAAAERMRQRFTRRDHVVLVMCGGNMSLNELIKCREFLQAKPA